MVLLQVGDIVKDKYPDHLSPLEYGVITEITHSEVSKSVYSVLWFAEGYVCDHFCSGLVKVEST